MQLAPAVWVDETPPGSQPLPGRDLLVLVGLTGVGKSTTLAHLRPQFAVLPDRREVTDAVIFAGQTVSDRAERFRRTAAYREAHPGGMASALGRVSVGLEGDLLFDGLRGLEEVTHAVQHLPRARFVALEAPDEVRVTRLLGRADAFDRVQVGAANASALEMLAGIAGIEAVFDRASLGRLAALPHPPEDIAAKASIVVNERHHYDPAPAHALLRTLPAPRALVLDTVALDSPACAARILHWWRAP
jgi:hypothetical protein